jgi:uncharacterized protein YkwD
MQKLSGWTAFIIVCVSLGISKYLSIAKQTSLPTLETPTEFITSPSSTKSPKPISIAKQTSLLISETPTEIITLHSLNKSPKPTSILEQEVFETVNDYRVSHHLLPLNLDSRISEQARIYSQAIASGQVPFGQEGLELHTEAISNVISYQGICENVAYNLGFADPARAAVNSWLRNPKRGVVDAAGEYELTGIGVATNIKGEYYFTQIFVHQ